VADLGVTFVDDYVFLTGRVVVSQPTLRREGDAGLTGASSMGGKCAESPPTFI